MQSSQYPATLVPMTNHIGPYLGPGRLCTEPIPAIPPGGPVVQSTLLPQSSQYEASLTLPPVLLPQSSQYEASLTLSPVSGFPGF